MPVSGSSSQPVMVMALDDHGDIAGLASSLGGMLLRCCAAAVLTMLAGPLLRRHAPADGGGNRALGGVLAFPWPCGSTQFGPRTAASSLLPELHEKTPAAY